MGKGTGSLRQKAKSIIGKELDQGIIESIGGMSLQGNLLLGGDFNLDVHSAARMLSKAVSRTPCVKWTMTLLPLGGT